MIWFPILIFAAIVAVVLLLKRAGQISPKAAREHLKNGALVIDVRTANEFNSGHLPQAINIPLNQIETAVTEGVHDKNQVLLLHCFSGTRSGMAQGKLKNLGYTNVFNLGSFDRAKAIFVSAN